MSAAASTATTTLGVLGGGQLGRMFVHAAQRLGYNTAVLDPDPLSPAGLVSHRHIQTAYTDPSGLDQLAQCCRAVTTEFENVPALALAHLARSISVAPGADAVSIAQDRIREKAYFASCGVPVAPYAVIETEAQLAAISEQLLPGVLKTARLGYDGKGQIRVQTHTELVQAWDKLQRAPCVLEQLLALQQECSVIVARGHDGSCVSLPLQCNQHRNGILAITEIFEGNVPAALAQRADTATRKIANELNYVGVLCVEFFVLASGELLANEMAPRPHNSGHYSIDACDVSQFELQVRTLADLPLVQPRQHSPALMLNLLGDIWPENGEPPWSKVLALPGAHLHLYGKTKASKGRKMGHLTVTGANMETVRATAQQAAQILGLDLDIAPF